jgi:rubredoxin
MTSYVCPICGHVHVEELGDILNGIEPGTAWDDIPDDWFCPSCYATKDSFVELDG